MKNKKKIINNSKLILYIALLFMYNINNTVATTIAIQNGPNSVNFNEIVVKSYLPWVLSVAGMLIFLAFILGIIIYIFCKKNIDKNKQKITITKKIISLSLKGLILIFVLYLFITIFEYELINVFDKIN
ncbi:MAG: hypothetical protein KAI67_04100 [Candidatus Pacebacteria bacterium]|nr:hypothetical protein [Candidatus Paceibacterota bacterium]